MRLRDAHFYRKVPRDVSEATKLGGLVSLLAIGTIAWLVYEEYSSYRSERQVTKMGLDHSMMPTPLGEDAFDSVRVNFNISMLRIPCQYASLQVADHVGSHQMGGARNTHKVRLDKDGRSIGMYQPHKYSEEANANLAEHVFPWHKQMHTQGDANQRHEATRQGLSAEQEVIVAGVEDKMQHSAAGKKALKPVAPPTARKLLSLEPEDFGDAVAPGAVQGRATPAGGPALHRSPTRRRLLSVEPAATGSGAAAAADAMSTSAGAVAGAAAATQRWSAPVGDTALPAAKEAAEASKGTAAQGAAAGTAAAAPQGAGAADAAQPATAPEPAAPTAGNRDKSLLRPDASQSCVQWRDAGECLKNSAFMLFKCQTSCAELANANACRTWAAERSRCNDGARAFMDNFCDGYCDQSPPEPQAQPPASPQATAGTPEAVANTAQPVAAAAAAQPEGVPQQAAADGAAKADGAAAVAETTAKSQPTDGATAAAAAAATDSNAAADADGNAAAASADSADKGSADGPAAVPEEDFVPGPFDDSPSKLTDPEFEALVKRQPALMVNFYAPWCFWSQKLMPAWNAVAQRLHKRAYSQSISFLHVDCTQDPGRSLCQKQSVHAFPSIRSYRGSVHAFEPYEHGREESVIWLHLVKLAAEAVVERVKDSSVEERQPFATQISHISEDLKVAMERREQGLDEDWTDDALSPEEEVAEDKELLDKIHSAALSIVSAKGVHATELVGDIFKMEREPRLAEGQAVQDRSADVVLGLLRSDRKPPAQVDEEGNALEPWLESETHEGCMIFGYVDVSRAPGTIHISPHSSRHSFDFANVNTSHHIDHLSFGLELGAFQRELLPAEVRRHLKPLDGRSFITSQSHETQEHHVNIVPTSYRQTAGSERIETYQFTATSNARTKDTLPSMLISYDVSPIQVHISHTSEPFSDLIVSLCAIIGGAFTIFGILDAILFTSGRALRKKLA